MKILTPSSEPLGPGSSVVTIGVYDGVHLGHQATLARVIAEAHAAGRHAVVATFDRHPTEVVRPDRTPLMLCSLDERLRRLELLGLDATMVIPFDEARAAESAEDFVKGLVVGHLGATRVVVGEDFRFGHGRRGDVSLLEQMGVQLGFSVEGVHLDSSQGEPISSTRIRAALVEGNVTEACRLLGRPHEVGGEVIHGDGRGGPELGYPTANVQVPAGMAIPKVGIYAGWYQDDGTPRHPAAISVGRRPMFYESADPLVEAHLVDFEGDLYGRAAKVSFLDHLRDEKRFDSVEALIEQMGRDVATTRDLCARHGAAAPPH